MITRRTLLAASVLLPIARASAEILPLDGDASVLPEPGGTGAVLIPALRARQILTGRVGGMPLIAASFGVPCVVGTLDLLALCGGAPFRLQALELWRWRTDDGTDVASRLTVFGDGSGVRLARDAARKRSPTDWARESWEDRLGWVAGGLVYQPVRPPLQGSWQARLASARRSLVPAPPFVPDAAIAAVLHECVAGG